MILKVHGQSFYSNALKMTPVALAIRISQKALRGEICSRVALGGKAVEQILNGVQEFGNDSRFHFGPGYIQKYVDEYTMDYID